MKEFLKWILDVRGRKTIVEEYNYLQYKIKKQLNLTNLNTFSLSNINTKVKQEEYEQKYLNSNSTLQYLQTQIEAYQTYKTNMEAKGDSYIRLVNKSDIELQLLDLKQQQYKLDVSLSIRKRCNTFQSQTILLASKNQEISNTELKLKGVQTLYRKGKAKKIEITKLKTELVKLKYEKVNLLYHVLLYRNEHELKILKKSLPFM